MRTAGKWRDAADASSTRSSRSPASAGSRSRRTPRATSSGCSRRTRPPPCRCDDAVRDRKEKERLLGELLRRASPDEAAWIARNATGEMRAGAQEGMLLEAIAAATDQPPEAIRRALIAAGDVAAVAEAALTDDGAGL